MMAAPRGYGTTGPGPERNGGSGGNAGNDQAEVAFADFSPTELYTLMESVAANLTAINQAVKHLERTHRHIGSPRDTPDLREKAHDTQQTANASMTATARDLRRLGVVVRRGDKRQKLQVEKLRQNFTDSVNKYSTVQKQLSEKMQTHMPKTPMQEFPPDSAEDDDVARLIAQKQAQAQAWEVETGLLEEREEYMKRIEADVLDVNQIMQELGIYIQAQGVTIDTIESSIEAAGARVEEGAEELIKASRYQAKYRKKMFIIILIAVIIGIILTVVIVNSLKR